MHVDCKRLSVSSNTMFPATALQEFPSQLRAAAEPDPQNPGQLIALTEVERRVKYVQMFHQQLGVNHPLVHLMKRCLRNDPSKRPSADKVLDELKRLRETARELRDPYEGWSKLDMIKEMSRLRQQVRLATPTSGGEDVEALRSRVQQLQVSSRAGNIYCVGALPWHDGSSKVMQSTDPSYCSHCLFLSCVWLWEVLVLQFLRLCSCQTRCITLHCSRVYGWNKQTRYRFLTGSKD